MTNTSIPSNKIAIKVKDGKQGVMFQTQTLGIEFKRSHKELVTECPKCGATNTVIYWDGGYIQKHRAGVHCHECGMGYPVVIEEL
jgi:transcription elongation factor Elf1